MQNATPALVSVLTLSALATAQAPPAPLLAHWQFDETSGTVAADSGPLGNHGTLTNFGAAPWVAGQYGNGLQFDGTDDFMNVSINNGLPVYDGLGTPFSVTFWVKAPAQNDRRVYSEQDVAPSGGGPLFTLGSGSGTASMHGRLRVYIRTDDAQVTVSAFSNADIFDDTWHHVVYSDASGVARIYVDGGLDSIVDYSRFSWGPRGTVAGSYAAINSVTLGAVVRNQVIAAPLSGTIDDLRVYRCALDQTAAQVVHVNSAPATCSPSIGVYGRGCGPGPLDIVATGSAQLGGTIHLQLILGTPGSLAFLCFSTGGLTPIDLTPVGLPGCTSYLPTQSCIGIGALLGAGSSLPYPVPVPMDPRFSCLLVGFQAAALGSAGVELSPAALAQLGQ